MPKDIEIGDYVILNSAGRHYKKDGNGYFPIFKNIDDKLRVSGFRYNKSNTDYNLGEEDSVYYVSDVYLEKYTKSTTVSDLIQILDKLENESRR